ncbi:hypothetical protein GOODEAATRI_012565 [Goodea atripinnis]|uniref:ATP-dependent RNA helicase n=1 Tax=Goodea atripinnis TaxID=208336 RepID=A0ABV0N0V4_9TELE
MKGKWKPVELDPHLFSQEGLQDLICFEELTSYRLVNSGKAAKEIKPPKKQRKNWTNAALSGSEEKNSDVSAWKDLFVPSAVLEALSRLGFTSPTSIQALALPPAIRDRMDILGAAETAFGIPMIHTILEWKNGSGKTTEPGDTEDPKTGEQQDDSTEPSEEDDEREVDQTNAGSDEDEQGAEGEDQDEQLGCVRVIDDAEFDFKGKVDEGQNRPLLGLVLTPTRELAVQVKHHIDAVAKYTGKCLVIDEADRMVERGHFEELESLLEMLNTTHFNPTRQTFVFSATLTMVHGLPSRVLQKKKKPENRSKLEILMEKVGIKSKPKVIDLTRKEATVESLTETQICCQKDEKDFYLYYFLIQYPGRTMVFANSIECIKRLTALLVILDCSPLALHANMHQKQRLKNLERFAERQK